MYSSNVYVSGNGQRRQPNYQGGQATHPYNPYLRQRGQHGQPDLYGTNSVYSAGSTYFGPPPSYKTNPVSILHWWIQGDPFSFIFMQMLGLATPVWVILDPSLYCSLYQRMSRGYS